MLEVQGIFPTHNRFEVKPFMSLISTGDGTFLAFLIIKLEHFAQLLVIVRITEASQRIAIPQEAITFVGHDERYRLSSLTTADMQKFYNKIKKEGRVREHPIHGKTLADSMVRGVHMMLHEALDTAVKERLIAKNPTNGTTVPKCNYPEKQILGASSNPDAARTLRQYRS